MLNCDTAIKGVKKINRRIERVASRLEEKHRDVKNIIQRQLVTEGNSFRNHIIQSMRDTVTAPWYYKRGKKVHHPSLPGFPPAIDKGELVRSIMYEARGWTLEVGALGGGMYAKWLELGTRRGMAARPWLQPAVEQLGGGIIDRLKAACDQHYGEIGKDNE